MKTITNLANQPLSVTLLADDVLEFHASRLLLLFKVCGKSNRIDGLTKMAKLDFFIRYPLFFNVVCNKLGVSNPVVEQRVESSMIRFHYGPWDERYYHILSYLEAKQLIKITLKGSLYMIELTNIGNDIACQFVDDPVFSDIVKHMGYVKKVLGAKSGSALKTLIYDLFEDEVTKRALGEVIE